MSEQAAPRCPNESVCSVAPFNKSSITRSVSPAFALFICKHAIHSSCEISASELPSMSRMKASANLGVGSGSEPIPCPFSQHRGSFVLGDNPNPNPNSNPKPKPNPNPNCSRGQKKVCSGKTQILLSTRLRGPIAEFHRPTHGRLEFHFRDGTCAVRIKSLENFLLVCKHKFRGQGL